MEAWLNSVFSEIQSLPAGSLMSGSDIARRVRSVVGEPKDSRWWGAALMEAEMAESILFTGKCDPDVEFLPTNPIYKTPGDGPIDFWDKLREGAK